MLLRRLELVGFKSFASKTVLDFPAGITAVVGPNGSGKSNVIDAIRWLLGERDAKNIRGGRAEDLIFAGTPKRPRTGLAQATIVFDNRSKFFPSDYAEVAVSRRVSRDGDSEYFLNDASVRLKDIVGFFAESRLGTRGLTIVNQGNSDIFVRADPKERRAMIEEILGLRQFQLKKHEAERKLVTTRFNLEKVRAMIDELTPHLRLLRRQAARFEKQAELAAELKELEDRYFGMKLGQLEEELERVKPILASLEKEIAGREAELKKLQTGLASVERSGPKDNKNFDDYKKKRTALLEKRSALERELGGLEAKLDFIVREPKTEVDGRIATEVLEEVRAVIDGLLATRDLSGGEARLRNVLRKIESVLKGKGRDREKNLEAVRSEKDRCLAKLLELNKEIDELNKLESEFTGELEQFNAVFKKAFEAVETKRAELNQLENKKSKLVFEEERVRMRREELEHLARQTNRKIDDFKSTPGVVIDLDQCEKRMLKLRGELSGIGELDPLLIKEAKETESRYEFLSSQVADLEKSSADLEILIRDLDLKLHSEFSESLKAINDQFNHFFRLMFGGGRGHLRLVKEEPERREQEGEEQDGKEQVDSTESQMTEDADLNHPVDHGGIEVELSIPRKKIKGLEMLSGGERSLVSIAALFALVSVSPPPFLVLDEVDAALDEGNARRFAEIVNDFSTKTQFLIVTHNRATMEAADILYGVTMGEDGTSKVLSLKLEQAAANVSAKAV